MTDMAERYFLGSILTDSSLIYDAMGLKLRESDFSTQQYRAIWRAIIALYERNEPCDALVVSEEIHRRHLDGECTWVAPSTIFSLTRIAFPNAEPLATYADILAPDRLTRPIDGTESIGELLRDTMGAIGRDDPPAREAYVSCALCHCDQNVMCADCLCHPEITEDDVAEMGSTLGICSPCMANDHDECLEVSGPLPDSGPCLCRTCGGGE